MLSLANNLDLQLRLRQFRMHRPGVYTIDFKVTKGILDSMICGQYSLLGFASICKRQRRAGQPNESENAQPYTAHCIQSCICIMWWPEMRNCAK